MSHPQYPIGELGQPWQTEHRQQWLAKQHTQRHYQTVLDELAALSLANGQRHCYGKLAYDPAGQACAQACNYPLYAVYNAIFDPSKPWLLVTGGVHGYETSGVHGALQFIREHFDHYAQFANLVVLPCISPWGYETINRWNPAAIDPNRSFTTNSLAPEAAQAMTLVHSLSDNWLMHIDLHETTDSDNSEFRPAKAARDGTTNHNWNIPDGFYLVGDSENPQPAFQKAIIDRVASVTHIAPADDDGQLIGEPLAQFGVINYANKALGLCAGMTNARFTTTTEVYPDSPNTDADECNAAQVAAVCAAIDFALSR